MLTPVASTAVLIGAALLARPAGAQAGHFSDQTQALGCAFNHFDGAFSYAMGGGSGWLDLENDGDQDLFCVSSDGRNKLFRWDGAAFTDVTTGAGISSLLFTFSAIGITCADYDGDGLVDAYVTTTGPNQLFENQGDGTFTDVAAAKGCAGNAWSSSASWADFDLDGDLDLYVGNYIQILNFPYHFGWPNQLYLNNATQFTDVAELVGAANTGVFGPTVPGYPYVSPVGQPTGGCTLSTGTLDYDEDGDPDLQVGNDFGLFVLGNVLLRNDLGQAPFLQFTDVTGATQFGQMPHYNMGINPCDYDHDGDWDFYESNLGYNPLLRNDGGVFTEVAALAGPSEQWSTTSPGKLLSSWGTVWRDFDNDGWEDLFVVNGWIPAADFIANDARAEDHLWLNDHDGTFTEVLPAVSGLADPGAGRGVAWHDFDADGDLDLHVMNNGAPGVAFPGDTCRLQVNQGTLPGMGANHWLELRARGWKSNGEGLGLRLEAYAGDLFLKRQVLGDSIFISSPSRTVHLGLGGHAFVDRLAMHWPSGIEQEIHAVPADLVVELVEPRVTLEALPTPSWSNGLMHFPVAVENRSNVPLFAVLFFQFFLDANGGSGAGSAGPKIMDLPVLVTVQPGAAVFEGTVPLDRATEQAFQGLPLFERVYVVSEGAFDSQVLAFPLP
jgi:hypothetical protein